MIIVSNLLRSTIATPSLRLYRLRDTSFRSDIKARPDLYSLRIVPADQGLHLVETTDSCSVNYRYRSVWQHVYSRLKCFVDSVVALLLLLMLLPFLLLVAMLIRWRLGAQVFFLQQRPGYRGRPFGLLKFRTMTNARDASGALLPDAERLTNFGRWLRSTSIDELPALVNILRGEMSFVGPRPLLMQYLSLYTCDQARRHDVKPGLSGWAQINGRNSISWEQKFRFDIWYVEHQGFRLDLLILLITVWKVLRRESINAPGQATMTPYMGTPEQQ